jgi:hypothetical protein
MKRLLKKRYLIPTIAIVVLAVAGGTAYAWWTATASTTGNGVGTGSIALDTSGLPIVVSGLAPMTSPALNAADSAYPSVSYFYVHNGGSIKAMFYGWLSGGNDPNNIRGVVDMRIWLLGSASASANGWTGMPSGWQNTFNMTGGPYLVYDGTLDGLWSGAPAGRNFLSSRGGGSPTWIDTPINPGEYGVYRVAVWLDSSASDPSTQNASVGFTINFTSLQMEQWALNGYDSVAKY